MLPCGSLSMMKSRGPSTQLWGTPCDKGAVEEVQLLTLMNCCLFVRNDLNLESAVPVMSRENSRQQRRMVWQMVSKAAVRSRKRRMER